MGNSVSIQTISRSVKQCITECYKLVAVPVPAIVKYHSTRAMVTSLACLKHVPIGEIY